MASYSFDTSSLLNGRRDDLPPRTFRTLWERIEDLVGTSVFAVDPVKAELERKHDETFAWARAQDDLFVPLEEDIQLATREVLTRCPKLVAVGGRRDGADLFVVAFALARDGAVVSQESPGRSLNKPRIPDACEAVGVRCLRLVEFIEEQGWEF